MNLTPLQQFIQDKILLSIYPWCSIEEARLKEFEYSPSWFPISLSRVLTALWECFYYDWNIYIEEFDTPLLSNASFLTKKRICDRKLLNEDWTDCNLFQQSQDTITAIGVLLWYKDE